MLRVALITNIFAHYRRPLYQLLLAHPRYQVTIIGDADSSSVDSSIASSIPYESARVVLTKSHRLMRRFIWQTGVLSAVAFGHYDIIIFVADMNNLSTWMGTLLARFCGKRIYFWAHGWRKRTGGIEGRMRRMFFSLPDRVLFYGRRARAIAVENGMDPQRVHVIYNSLDYDAQCKARQQIDMRARLRMREQLFGHAQGAVVACSTRLVRQRRLDLLLEAVALVRCTSNRQISILLVGDGPERRSLEAQSMQLGLNVHFAGACYDEVRMAAYLTTATCTVAPGVVGLSAMHSLAFGVPVLTHGHVEEQMPEAEAVVEGVTGGYFSENDVADLARVMGVWTQEDFPTEKISAACIRVIERFYNPDIQLELIIRALDEQPAANTLGEAIQPSELTTAPR
jgi:glycosyltransferase involved in cell wall biosynthesis